MKKTISILLTFIMLLTMLPMSTFAAELNSPKLTIDSFDSMPGDNVNVSINLKNNPGIVSGQINVAFDTGLTLIGATKGDAFPSYITFTMPKQLSTVGEINDSCNIVWGGTDINDADIKDGTVLVLTFRVSADAEIGDTYNISVTPSHVNDKNLVAVELNTVQSSITIIDYTPGDVNDDGIISMLDTVMISRYIVDGCTYDPDGYAIRLNENAANVNDDGIISMLDTVMISRYIVDGCKTDPDGYNVRLIRPTKKCQHEMQATEAKAETCTENGNIAYWHCNLCDKYFADVNGSRVITFEDTIIPAKGHTVVIDPAVPATDTSTGLTEGSHCSVCEEILVPQIVIPIPEPQTANITYKLVNNDSYLASQEINNPNPSTYTLGKGLTLSNDIEVPGYTFLGWYDSFASNATQIKSIPASATEDITLYAHWEVIEYTIQYDSDLSPVNDETYKTYYINQGKVLPTPRLDGYKFVGWSDEDGNILKRIPVGTSGHQTYTANWLSERNQAWTKKSIGDPVIYEDTENNQILFTYEIGEIRNVPINVIKDFGKINSEGISLEETVEYSETTSESQMYNFASTISKATTDSFGWSLSNGWSDQVTVSNEWMQQNEVTEEEAQSIAQNESNNWYVSSGQSGTDTVTTYDSTENHNLKTTTKNKKTYNTKNTQTRQDFSAELDLEASRTNKINAEIPEVGGASKETTLRAEVDLKYSNGRTVDKKTGTEKDSGTIKEKGTISHTGSDTVHTGSWNSESGSGGSKSFTQTDSTRRAVTELVSEKTGYGKSYIQTNNSNETQGFSESNTNTNQYSTTVTYNKIVTETITQHISTSNTKTGYHRWINAGTAHVFAVVGYDIVSQSYFVTNLVIMDDEVHRFEDYSYDSAAYNDNEIGRIDFTVPTDIEDYVLEKITYSDGLEFSRDGIVTGYIGRQYTSSYEVEGETIYEGPDDFVIIPEYKVITGLDGKNTVIKITGIDSGAFQGNNFIMGVEFSDFIDTIPDNAFKNCTSLMLIKAKGITRIGNNAFEGCEGLKYAHISENVTELGDNAFGSADEIEAMAANLNVVKSIIDSGSKNIVLGISDKCNDLEEVDLTVPETVESFKLYGFGKNLKNVTLDTKADCTEIINTIFTSTKKIPLKIASQDVIFGELNISAPNFGAIFTAEQTNLSLYGETRISSAKGNAILSRSISLGKIGNELYSQLQLNGNVLACGNVEKNGLISFTSTDGKVVIITEAEYQKHLGGVYTITFNANEGKVSEISREAYFGVQTESLPTPTRDYYTFDGWYTEKGDTPVTPETLLNNSDDITLYAHWILNPVSGWTKASDVPSGAQIVNTKWTYTYRDWKTSSSSSMSGYTRDDSKTTYTISWGDTNWYDSQRSTSETYRYMGTRTVENGTETYQSGSIHHWKYYHRKTTSGTWGSRDTVPHPEPGAEHNIDITWALDFRYAGSYGIMWYGNYACPQCGAAGMWICDGEYDEPVYSQRTVYKTQYGYQQGTKNYTYSFYKDIAKESSSDPTGQSNVSNVVKMVQYRAKTYQSGTIHHWRYYHRKHGSVWGSRDSLPNPDQGEHNIDITWALDYRYTGSSGIMWYGNYACPQCGAEGMWICDGEYDEPVYSQ